MSDRLEEFKKHWAGIQDFDEIDPQLVAGLIAEVERLRGELDWHRQTVHRAHHDQPMETCEKNTCQGARKALEGSD